MMISTALTFTIKKDFCNYKTELTLHRMPSGFLSHSINKIKGQVSFNFYSKI